MSDDARHLARFLAQGIKSRCPDGISSSEMSLFENKYLSALGPNPGNNWLSKMGWASVHVNYLREALTREDVRIRPDVQIPLHDYELSEAGYKRLSELEELISSYKRSN